MQDDCLMLELPAFWTTLFGDRFDWLCLHAISFEELHTNQIEELDHWYQFPVRFASSCDFITGQEVKDVTQNDERLDSCT
jgi:hypothetical protein